MSWLASTWYGFLLRCFFMWVVLIFIYKFSRVKKYNCSIVYLQTPLGRDSFQCGDRSHCKKCRLIDWFLYTAPFSIEGFLKSESFIKNFCVKICNTSNTLHAFHIPSNNVSKILSKKNFNLEYFPFFQHSICFLCDPVSNKFCLNVISLLCYFHYFPFSTSEMMCHYYL